MKTAIKFIILFILCIIGGFLIGSLAGSLFSGKSIIESIVALKDLELWEIIGVPLVAILSAIISFFILVIIHEAGHLVAGIMTGYKFVSFRIFNFTFIKEDGKLKIKKFSIAGTGGQCLLSPPDVSVEELPVFWYNIGGVVANMVALFIALPFLWIVDNPFATMFIAIFIAIDVILILMNGIPLNRNGLCNDAGNIRILSMNLKAKRALMSQLECNSLIQVGVRPKDMPDSFFTYDVEEAVNYKNPLEVTIPMMAASRLVDLEEYEEAYHAFSELYSHKDEIMGLYVKEIACELAYTAMVTGRLDEARNLLDEELMKYISGYRKVMSSKERILFAKTLILDADRKSAEEIYETLSQRSSDYLLQGEVKSDLSLMSNCLNDKNGIEMG